MGEEEQEGSVGSSQAARRECKHWVGGKEGHRGKRGCIRGTTESLVWMGHSTMGEKGESRELGRNHKNMVLKIMMKV